MPRRPRKLRPADRPPWLLIAAIFAVWLTLSTLIGCQTIAGLGRDLSAVGDWSGDRVASAFRREGAAP